MGTNIGTATKNWQFVQSATDPVLESNGESEEYDPDASKLRLVLDELILGLKGFALLLSLVRVSLKEDDAVRFIRTRSACDCIIYRSGQQRVLLDA